ncbi:MAG TPA: hypothetical protein VJ165_05905 [candidate division Zixibacteria bacterium]|nr:hypothetical protein [candidate division Zixibacteria bacterium]
MTEPLLEDFMGQGIFKRYEELPKLCYLCGRDDVELTKDDLPPKCLFPEAEWHRLLKVPACYSCNNKRKKDDEYLRNYVTIWSGKRIVLPEVWEKMERSFYYRPSLLVGIQKNMRLDWKYDESGMLLPQHYVLAEKHRIDPVFDNIARGYWFARWGKRLSTLQSPSFIGYDSGAEFWYNKTAPLIVIPGMFQLKFNWYKEGAINISNWYLHFYKLSPFYLRFSWEQNN